MNYLVTLKSLYALNGLVAVLLYVPQIVNAWRDRNAVSLSLVTFGGWGAGSVISLLYAWWCVKDQMFTAVSLGNLIGSGAMFCIIAGRRFSRRRDDLGAPSGRVRNGLRCGSRRAVLRDN